MLEPPQPEKESNPLRFGILGAANIAPPALINPALSHPGVVVAAVAARDEARAQAYATKHKIPKVFKSYQGMKRFSGAYCVAF
jgi:predicted dehydrogenase